MTMEVADRAAWRRCSSCKREIPFDASYFRCSVSTCNRKRTGLTFCSVDCWEAHLPLVRHREAFAVDAVAPSRAAWQREQAREGGSADSPAADFPAADSPVRRRVVAPAAQSAGADASLPRDVLVVVSKLKKYIRARSGMNTSDGTLEVISDHVRALCDQAIRNAGRDGRRTVLERDFPPAVELGRP